MWSIGGNVGMAEIRPCGSVNPYIRWEVDIPRGGAEQMLRFTP
jgi:hypothetical protein